MHKLREAMTAEMREVQIEGEVEVDGAVFGGRAPTSAVHRRAHVLTRR